MLTSMVVAEKNIFADVPEIELFALLIFNAADVGIFELLYVKACSLDDDFCHRQNLADVIDDLQMSVDTILNSRSQPALFLRLDAV